MSDTTTPARSVSSSSQISVLWVSVSNSDPMMQVAAATPMTYVSPRTGRQYVVIQAGGHYAFPGPQAAAIMAFALPK